MPIENISAWTELAIAFLSFVTLYFILYMIALIIEFFYCLFFDIKAIVFRKRR